METKASARLIHQDDVPIEIERGVGLQWLVDQELGARHVMAYRCQLAGRNESHAHVHQADEVIFVTDGGGVVVMEGSRHEVRRGEALFIPAGSVHHFVNAGSGDLVVMGAMSPAIDIGDIHPALAEVRAIGLPGGVVREAAVPPTLMSESTVAPTMMGERSFRLLVNPDVGCRTMTQFTGIIPPGRAPLHAHPYEEATYVLSGHGRLWIEDEPFGELRPGSMAFLPIGVRHTLENTTQDTILKVLGAFSPANSPEAKLPPDRR